MAIQKKHVRSRVKEKRTTKLNPLERNRVSTKSSKNKSARGLGSINPQPIDVDEENKIEKFENDYDKYLNAPNSTLISSFDMKTYDLKANCEEALHDLLNLEVNGNYLSEQRLSSWKSVISDAKLFNRLLVYVSISYGLPSTKGMTQGQYFSEFFDLSSDSVVKTFKNTEILVFLYLGASHINQVKDLNLLMSIGNENDLVCNKLIEVQKQYGDAFLLKVFQECQGKVKSISEIK
jgi:hypothetical protein